MKKLLCLVLCLVMTCTMLVACGDETIGDGIKDYPDNTETVERLNLNLYIITEDSTTSDAKSSVATRIAGHTKTTYNTVLNIFYVTASKYESTVDNAIKNGGENAPHIILINSKSMFDKLNAAGQLLELTDYYGSRDYGRLNTQITSSLLEASKLDGKYFTVPNNRVIGEYEYLVINKEVAMQTLKYGNKELSAYKSLDDAAALIAEMDANGYNSKELVKIVKGDYKLREELSVDNFCNIISTPTITADEAFSSAFAIVKNTDVKYNDRAMQMIYALNTDLELRGFLQYGVLGANYEIHNGDIVKVKDGKNNYDMNLEYTGDVFKADSCSEIGWTNQAKAYGTLQNADSKYAK